MGRSTFSFSLKFPKLPYIFFTLQPFLVSFATKKSTVFAPSFGNTTHKFFHKNVSNSENLFLKWTYQNNV